MMTHHANRWDRFFMGVARESASMSKDPSTKVGAVIVRPDRTIASTGFNGFPRRAHDHAEVYADRDRKLLRVIHAELNAILTAKERLDGYRLYVRPLPPCARCAAAIVQAGITSVVCEAVEVPERWRADMAEAEALFEEAGVSLDRIEL